MISLRARSLARLVLAGFLLVTLPLVVIIGTASLYVDALAQQSEQLVARGVHLARMGKEVEEKILAMERNARQYQVLGDLPLVDLASKRRSELAAILTELEQSRAEALSEWHLDQMREDSMAIVKALSQEPPQSLALALELKRFDRLREHATAIRAQSDQFINSKSDMLKRTADNARRFLLIMAITLIPAVVLLALYFTVQIARPVNQIESAIRNIGRGGFTRPIVVNGPHELELLGARLEWLRSHLTELEDEKNLFLRRMSHELKTPLASLREGAELLMDGTAGRLSDMQMEIADILRNNSLELQFLVENLLDYEQWREKSSNLDISRFAVRPLIDAVLQRHRLIIANKHLRMDLRFRDFEMQADRERIRITLSNLLSNAIKFAPQDGTVYICAESRLLPGKGRLVTFDIADTGCGIHQEDRAHIFDAFYQGQASPESHVRGTGIGLSVVRECVNAHSGSIEIIDGEFPGAHFRIRLPSPPLQATT